MILESDQNFGSLISKSLKIHLIEGQFCFLKVDSHLSLPKTEDLKNKLIKNL